MALLSGQQVFHVSTKICTKCILNIKLKSYLKLQNREFTRICIQDGRSPAWPCSGGPTLRRRASGGLTAWEGATQCMAVTTNFRKCNKTHRAPTDAQNVALLNDLRNTLLLTVWSSSLDTVQTIRRLFLSYYKVWELISYNLFFKLPHKWKIEVALFTGNWHRNCVHFPADTHLK